MTDRTDNDTLPPPDGVLILPTRPRDSLGWTDGYTAATVRRLLARARAQEREACAQAAQPDDSYQDEWFKAKADAVRRIRARNDMEADRG